MTGTTQTESEEIAASMCENVLAHKPDSEGKRRRVWLLTRLIRGYLFGRFVDSVDIRGYAIGL
jgi:hypothetical protein